ncbi:hypothetical protein [Buchananella felis]|uniref:hypothetical protein n=1 Tax=Buchananella felis TaxID=3231492 RepID=UPI00352813A5
MGLLDFSEFSDHVGAGLGALPDAATGFPGSEHPFVRLAECEPIRRIFNAIELALADHSAVSGYRLLEAVDPDTGELGAAGRIVTDNGGPFRSLNFELFIMQHPELRHVHARVKSPGQNGSRERDLWHVKEVMGSS